MVDIFSFLNGLDSSDFEVTSSDGFTKSAGSSSEISLSFGLKPLGWILHYTIMNKQNMSKNKKQHWIKLF